MKKLIISLLCLFLSHAGCGKYIGPDWGGLSNCYALDYSEIGARIAKQTNEKFEDEIADILSINDILWLAKAQSDLNYLENMRHLREVTRRNYRRQYQLDHSGYIFGGILKLGIAYWGFSQNSRYGNVTGGLFALSGVVQLFRVEW